jgi:prepilin-type N-terminal cleavage/methylation domain-containing protein
MVKSRSGSRPSQFTTRDNRGVTLVELLISMGILSLIMSLIVVVLSNQAHETRAARENLAAIEVENAALRALADGSVCKYVLNRNPVTTFNSTRLPQTRSLGLKPIYTPSSFSEAFVSSNVGWGLGCKAGWRLTSCAINTGGDADVNFYSTDTSLPVCFSDNEEWGGTISAICCKVQ